MQEWQVHRVVQLIDFELKAQLSNLNCSKRVEDALTSSIQTCGVKMDSSRASTSARMLSLVDTLPEAGCGFLIFGRRGGCKNVRGRRSISIAEALPSKKCRDG